MTCFDFIMKFIHISLYFIFFNLYKQVTLLKKKSKSRLAFFNFFQNKKINLRYIKKDMGDIV